MRKRMACAVAVAVVLLAGCGSSTPTPSPTPTATPVGDLPPLWVQHEVSWQALDAGDAHPGVCRWTLVPASHAVELDSKRLADMRDPGFGQAYVAIVQGDFQPPTEEGWPASARFMYLVMDSSRGHHLMWGFLSARPRVRALGHLHAYRPTPPHSAEVWGHTMFGGGIIAGAYPIPHVPVGVWRGIQKNPGGAPLRSVSSDANGFFDLALPDGVYTLKLLSDKHGWTVPTRVTVQAGQPVAAGVYGEGM